MKFSFHFLPPFHTCFHAYLTAVSCGTAFCRVIRFLLFWGAAINDLQFLWSEGLWSSNESQEISKQQENSHCGVDTQDCLQGLNSCAGLLAASWGCSQLWQCLVLTDRSAEKRLNHTATSGLLDQQCLARFISPTWGWAVFWGDAVTVHLSEPCSTRQTCRFLISDTQRCSFCLSVNLKIS